MKSPHTGRPTQCPYCKTPNYAVEYRGAKTLEEKGIEQAEEQKVIEARIRIRQKELHDEEERMLKREGDLLEGRIPVATELLRRNFSNLHGFTLPADGTEDQDTALAREQGVHLSADSSSHVESVQIAETQDSPDLISAPAGNSSNANARPGSECGAGVHGHAARAQGPLFSRFNREDDFDLDLEDIMVMEAIWLSIQEQGQPQTEPFLAAQQIPSVSPMSRNETSQNCMANNNRDTGSHVRVSGDTREVSGRNSVTGGLAGAIAALAEQQVLPVENGAEQIPQNRQVSENELGNVEDGEHIVNVNSSNEAPFGTNEVSNGNNTGEFASDYAAPGFYRQPGRHGQTEEEQQGPIGEKVLAEEMRSQQHNSGQGLDSWIEVSVESGRALSPHVRGGSTGSISDWMLDHSSEAVEVGTSFSSSVPSASDLPWEAPDILAPQTTECTGDLSGLPPPSPMLPESYEEQMMLAMALSLAEAQAQARSRRL